MDVTNSLQKVTRQYQNRNGPHGLTDKYTSLQEPLQLLAEAQLWSIIMWTFKIAVFEQSDISAVHKFLMVSWDEILTVSFYGNSYRLKTKCIKWK